MPTATHHDARRQRHTPLRIFFAACCLSLALGPFDGARAETVEQCLERTWQWCWEMVAKGDLEVTAQCYLHHAAYCTPGGTGTVAPGPDYFTATPSNRPLFAPSRSFGIYRRPQYFPPVIPTHQYGNWLGANCRRVVNQLCCPCRIDSRGRYTGVCCHPIR